MKKYKIAVIPGDGIGPEVINEGIKVIKAIEKASHEIKFEFEYFPWGAENYLDTGMVAPDNFLDILKPFDAIYLGAIGHPDVPDFQTVGKLIFGIRRGFDEYVNYRPIKLLKGVKSPLDGKNNIDMLFIRENEEGEYGDVGGRIYPFTGREAAIQVNIFTRYETERIMRYAFDRARERNGHVTAITKSNALKHSMEFWDQIFHEISEEYPDIRTDKILVDAAAMYMVLEPERFDVVVASNLFGDILTDLGAALQGGLGFAPGANLNPEKVYPSMFEPIHGSAPSLKGKNVANPIASIWAAALMLQFLGENDMSAQILVAIERVLENSEIKTPDIGGNNSTQEMGEAVVDEIIKSRS